MRFEIAAGAIAAVGTFCRHILIESRELCQRCKFRIDVFCLPCRDEAREVVDLPFSFDLRSRVNPVKERRTDEANQVLGRADHRGAEGNGSGRKDCRARAEPRRVESDDL